MKFGVGAFLYNSFKINYWVVFLKGFSRFLDSPSPAVDDAMGKTSTLPILTHCVVQRQRNLHCVETRHKTIWQFFYFSDHSVSGTVAMLRLLAKETLKVTWIPSSPTRALATAAPAPSITQILPNTRVHRENHCNWSLNVFMCEQQQGELESKGKANVLDIEYSNERA